MLVYEAGFAQLPDVVRDQILRQIQLVGKLAVADLAAHQQQKDLAPRGVGEQLQEFRGRRRDVAKWVGAASS